MNWVLKKIEVVRNYKLYDCIRKVHFGLNPPRTFFGILERFLKRVYV